MIRAVLIDDEPQSLKAMVIKLSAVADDVEIVASISEPGKAVATLPAL